MRVPRVSSDWVWIAGFWRLGLTVSPSTDFAPESSKARAQAPSVAPVVNTSSTSKTRCLSTWLPGCVANAPRSAPRRFCRALRDVLELLNPLSFFHPVLPPLRTANHPPSGANRAYFSRIALTSSPSEMAGLHDKQRFVRSGNWPQEPRRPLRHRPPRASAPSSVAAELIWGALLPKASALPRPHPAERTRLL